MNMVTPIRGQPKNLERHIRSCPNSKSAAAGLPPPTPSEPHHLPHASSSSSSTIYPSQPLTLSGASGNIPHTPMPSGMAGSSTGTPNRGDRLSRQKQAELDADIYNLLTGLGIPFEDKECEAFGGFVRKWIPGAKWGEER